MKKKEKLNKDLEKINKSINNTLQAFEFCYYLNYPKIENELNISHAEYISKSGFFSFSRYALWRLVIIELHKLTNDNKETDKFNLHLLLRKLKKGGVYSSLNVSESKIIEWQELLNEQHSSISEVRNLRFKLYAHTDKNYKEIIESNQLNLKETEILINCIVKIVFEINLIVFDKHTNFEPVYRKESLKRIINDILENQERREKEIVQEYLSKANNK